MNDSSGDFKQLIERRTRWLDTTRENDFDFTPILSGLYSDPSHFVYELLQNAEDAGAKKVAFTVLKDRLLVSYDGRPFNFADVDSITGIGKSTKVHDINAIGKFGVGFKSVYAVSKSPTINSGEFHFAIESFVVPRILSSDQSSKSTIIELPFCHDLRGPGEILDLVTKRLENLGLHTLLFLKNISTIESNADGKSQVYSRTSVDQYQEVNNLRRVHLEAGANKEDYLVFERPIRMNGKEHRVEVAYFLQMTEEGVEVISKPPFSKLFVFFPTNEETNLRFLLQGPFKTTPARDNIPLQDTQNKVLIVEISELVASSLIWLKHLGFVTADFISLLPLKPPEKADGDIYAAVFSKVLELLKTSEALLPTAAHSHASSVAAIIAESQALVDFLEQEDLSKLFERRFWLDLQLTESKKPDVRQYLIGQLGVPVVDFASLVRRLSDEFMRDKTEEWIIRLYRALKDQRWLWRGGPLKKQPIIRLEDGSNVAPFDDDGHVQVYLPGKDRTRYRTVHPEIVKDEGARAFLEELGVTEPDLYAEVVEFIIPRFSKDTLTEQDPEYLSDFEKLLRVQGILRADRTQRFIESLASLKFVMARDTADGPIRFVAPSVVYLNVPALKEFYQGNAHIYFVSDKLYAAFPAQLETFLTSMGSSRVPRFVEFDPGFDWQKRRELQAGAEWRHDISLLDRTIEGLGFVLQNLTEVRSTFLWHFLVEHIPGNKWYIERFFQGDYTFRIPYNNHSVRFDAKFLVMLRSSKWLLGSDGQLHLPTEITADDLAAVYDKESLPAKVLIEKLGFRPSIARELLSQLPADQREKYELLLSLTPDQLDRAVGFARSQSSENINDDIGVEDKGSEAPPKEEWKPEIDAEEAPVKGSEFEPGPVKLVTSKEAEATSTIQGEQQSDRSIEDLPSEETEVGSARKIGRWGEEYVLRCLKTYFLKEFEVVDAENGFFVKLNAERTIEVRWLNRVSDKGKGCDILLVEGTKPIGYIEVKTTTSNEESLFRITGNQWKLASKLFEEERGDQYSIFVVHGAGKAECRTIRILNPIKEWREGRLLANLIGVKL